MPTIPEGLPGIGKATITLLRVRGIGTAHDALALGEAGHEGIPGVGHAKWAVLLDWSKRNAELEERMRLLDDWVAHLQQNRFAAELLSCGVRSRPFGYGDWILSGDSIDSSQSVQLRSRLEQVDLMESNLVAAYRRAQAARAWAVFALRAVLVVATVGAAYLAWNAFKAPSSPTADSVSTPSVGANSAQASKAAPRHKKARPETRVPSD